MAALKKGRLRCTTLPPMPGYAHANTWETQAWNGFSPYWGGGIWSDGTYFYYSSEEKQYVLHGNTWESKNWEGFSPISGRFIWTDGSNIYYSSEEDQYVLHGDKWEPKVWTGYTPEFGTHIWSDGDNIFYSNGYSDGQNYQYVLKDGAWESKAWASQPDILRGDRIWSDGLSIYSYPVSGAAYVLNGDTWEEKIWDGEEPSSFAFGIWSDGTNVYHSMIETQMILEGNTWKDHTWVNPATDSYTNGYVYVDMSGSSIWTDGINIYHSDDTAGEGQQLILARASAPNPVPQLNPAALMQGYMVGQAVRRARGQKVETPEEEKTLVGYSYNGSEPLPNIDEVWTDKETYPYAFIQHYPSFGYRLTIYSTAPYATSEPKFNAFSGSGRMYLIASGSWEFHSSEFSGVTDVFAENNNGNGVIWCSVDVTYGNTTYLVASEPVPVYE